MSTHADSPQATPAGTARRPRGPIRSVLRPHRGGLWVWLAYLAVTAGVLLWMYGPGGSAAAQDSAWCAHHQCVNYGAIDTYKNLVVVADVLIRAVPFLAAAYVGAVLVGRELETGMHRLAWTQSVSPARWLATRLAAPAAALTVGTGLLVGLFHLVRSAEFGVGNWDLYTPNVFYDGGLLAFVYPLLGISLGALAGLLLRRSIPALLAATAATAVVQFLLSQARFHLLPAATRTTTGGAYDVPRGAHLLDVQESGKATTSVYQPLSHVWPLQLIESGIVLALTAAAVYAAFRVLRHRTA